MGNELAVVTPMPMVRGDDAGLDMSLARANAIVARQEGLRALVMEVLKDGTDYGEIPGTKKKCMMQSGAQKVAAFCDARSESEVQYVELPNGHCDIRVTCRLLHRATGAVVESGHGSCSTMEKKYRYRTAQRICPECRKDTIKISKQPGSIGDFYCFAKIGGCGAKFPKDDPDIAGQEQGQVENEDIYDVRNTVLKMADKRAYVAAVLRLAGLSDYFTQDMDEVAHEHTETVEREQKAARVRNAKPEQPSEAANEQAGYEAEQLKADQDTVKQFVAQQRRKVIDAQKDDSAFKDQLDELWKTICSEHLSRLDMKNADNAKREQMLRQFQLDAGRLVASFVDEVPFADTPKEATAPKKARSAPKSATKPEPAPAPTDAVIAAPDQQGAAFIAMLDADADFREHYEKQYDYYLREAYPRNEAHDLAYIDATKASN